MYDDQEDGEEEEFLDAFRSNFKDCKNGILKRNFAHIFTRSVLSRIQKIRSLHQWEHCQNEHRKCAKMAT